MFDIVPCLWLSLKLLPRDQRGSESLPEGGYILRITYVMNGKVLRLRYMDDEHLSNNDACSDIGF